MAVRRPVLTVDVLIRRNDGYVFIKRRNKPYRSCWAIPGGLVEYGETVEQAAIREAKEETGLEVKLIRFVGVYSDPARDSRGHYVSIAYLAEAVSGELQAATDAEEAKVFKGKPERLAFDHSKIYADAIRG